MYTLNALSDEHVNRIYQNIVLYSIKKYESLPEQIQDFYKTKYEHALVTRQELNIDFDNNINEIKSFLQSQKELVNQITQENQTVIEELIPEILNTLSRNIPSDTTPLETCEFLFDYITNTMEYSEDWIKYCNNVPPVDGFDFSFYKGVPLSTTYEGLLITRKGICDDIANLFIYLGKYFNLPIGKAVCKHNENLHAINYIEIDGIRSYFDATSVILKTKQKEESFLVSEELLNKNKDYIMDEHHKSVTLAKKEKNYDVNTAIKEIDKIMPIINYISGEQYIKK